MLFKNRIVDVGRKLLGGHQPFSQTGVAAHDETFVQAHKVGNPVVYQQVVSDCHFGGGKVVPEESEVQERGVEDNVPCGW